MRKKLVSAAITAAVIIGVALPVFAQTTSMSVSDLVKQLTAQIEALKAQIATLQQAQNNVQQANQDVNGTLKLLGQLKEGMSGDDVKLLQTALAADPEIYPEGLISGYYGKLTSAAVKKFQKKHGLDQAGNVGKKTLEKLNEELEKNPVSTQTNEDGKKEPCAIVPPGHLIAPGWLKKHGDNKPVIPECQNLPWGIWKKFATTTPPVINDTTPPVISSVSSANITTSGASVSWATNELSGSKVYYGTASPLNLSVASALTSNSLVISHALNLTGLSSNTTYYYVVESSDAHGNKATSSQYSFATVQIDTTPPVISSVSSSNVSSTTATVGWTTNEQASSKVYYATTSPLNLSSAAFLSDSTLTLAHSLNLIGLTASTTYYYVVESKDASTNTATSSEQSFTTTQ